MPSDLKIAAAPRRNIPLKDCFFYHTFDLPEHGVVQGDWDLRPNIARYLGGADLAGKRVLDVGAANGYLTFHAESQGALVTSFDLSSRYSFDVAPSRYGHRRHAQEHRHYIERVNNGYWLAHEALRSEARMVYGTVYGIPAAIGPVDTAFLGCLLLHLRDPILALQNALRLTQKQAIVVEPLWSQRRKWMARVFGRLVGPYMSFAPQYWSDQPQATWWSLTPAIICRFLAAFGFEDHKITYHEQIYLGKPYQLFTVVADRTQPVDDFGLDAESADESDAAS